MDNNRRNQLTYKHEEYLSGDRVSTENQIDKISVNGYSNTHDTQEGHFNWSISGHSHATCH